MDVRNGSDHSVRCRHAASVPGSQPHYIAIGDGGGLGEREDAACKALPPFRKPLLKPMGAFVRPDLADAVGYLGDGNRRKGEFCVMAHEPNDHVRVR